METIRASADACHRWILWGYQDLVDAYVNKITKKLFMKIFRKNGFTLVEMLIVVAIIGILTAIATPNLMHYIAQRRLNGAARMVMSDLMWARQKAVSINQMVKVSFADVNNHAYEIWNDADKSGAVADNEGDNLVKDIHPDYYDVTACNWGCSIQYNGHTARQS